MIYLGVDHREPKSLQAAKNSLALVSPWAKPELLDAEKLTDRGLLWRPQDRRGQLYDLISNAPCSTDFAISRFLVPILCQSGWALFADSDVVFMRDVADLFDLADDDKAVMVVQHHNGHEAGTKMDGQQQLLYARKNWSSVMLSKGFLNDLREGVSVVDSLKNAFDSVLDTIFQIVAQNLAESLFGQSGTSGGGASGDFFSSIFGALFGARATGGSVNSGGMYRVNEQGPELLTVGNRDYLMMGQGSGMVSPAVGGGVTINNSYINPQLNDWRSESQRRVEEATQLRVASSRNG